MMWFHEPLSKRPTDQPFALRSWPTNSDIYSTVQYLLNLLWVNDLTLNIPKVKSSRKNKSVFTIIQSNYEIMVKDTYNWNNFKGKFENMLCNYFTKFTYSIQQLFFSASLVIISSYPASPRRITVLVNFQAILLISSGEPSSNRDIFFTDNAAKKNFSDIQDFSTRNSPSVFPYLVKLNDNGSYNGLRQPIRKLENHYPELKIY